MGESVKVREAIRNNETDNSITVKLNISENMKKVLKMKNRLKNTSVYIEGDLNRKEARILYELWKIARAK